MTMSGESTTWVLTEASSSLTSSGSKMDPRENEDQDEGQKPEEEVCQVDSTCFFCVQCQNDAAANVGRLLCRYDHKPTILCCCCGWSGSNRMTIQQPFSYYNTPVSYPMYDEYEFDDETPAQSFSSTVVDDDFPFAKVLSKQIGDENDEKSNLVSELLKEVDDVDATELQPWELHHGMQSQNGDQVEKTGREEVGDSTARNLDDVSICNETGPNELNDVTKTLILDISKPSTEYDHNSDQNQSFALLSYSQQLYDQTFRCESFNCDAAYQDEQFQLQNEIATEQIEDSAMIRRIARIIEKPAIVKVHNTFYNFDLLQDIMNVAIEEARFYLKPRPRVNYDLPVHARVAKDAEKIVEIKTRPANNKLSPRFIQYWQTYRHSQSTLPPGHKYFNRDFNSGKFTDQIHELDVLSMQNQLGIEVMKTRKDVDTRPGVWTIPHPKDCDDGKPKMTLLTKITPTNDSQQPNTLLPNGPPPFMYPGQQDMTFPSENGFAFKQPFGGYGQYQGQLMIGQQNTVYPGVQQFSSDFYQPQMATASYLPMASSQGHKERSYQNKHGNAKRDKYKRWNMPEDGTPTKALRKRISPEKRDKLVRFFRKCRFPSGKERCILGMEMGMTPRQVQIWFQNARNNKDKRSFFNRQHSA